MCKAQEALLGALLALISVVAVAQAIQEYPVPTGSLPHDVEPVADGNVW